MGYIITYYQPQVKKRIIYLKPGSGKSCFDKKVADKIAKTLEKMYTKAHPRVKADKRCDITAW